MNRSMRGYTKAEELHGYEYIPVAANVAGISSATGKRDRQAFIVLEAEVVDSSSGERLAMAVRKDDAK